jgi:hypothetical protein
MRNPTKIGTIKYVGKKKYIAVSCKKTGKNCYTTIWQEIKIKRR